ncbi:type VI secretion system contractile sheath large subunit [Enterobacter hormaechei]|nr:type VI secretion system contractile sheath large subunit [Enterobacter hormaechei]
MDCIRKSGQPVEKLDKTLIDHHIAELDFQISRQLDAVMHHQEFQKVESLWRGLKQLVDSTDYPRMPAVRHARSRHLTRQNRTRQC